MIKLSPEKIIPSALDDVEPEPEDADVAGSTKSIQDEPPPEPQQS